MKATHVRDLKRINTVLAKVKEVWLQYPDLRLTQMLENATRGVGYSMFFVEDDKLIELLDKWKDE